MAEEGPYSSLRAKLQALLVLAVSVWGLWEGKVVQGLLHNPRTDRCVATLLWLKLALAEC